MGLLSSISGAIEKGLGKVEKAVSTVYQATLAKIPGVSQVKSFVEKNPEVAVGGLAISATGLGAKTIAKGVVSSAPALIPSTTKGKVVGAVAGLATAGAIAKAPQATISAIAKTPGAIANFGGNVAKFASSPSVETAKQIVTENPVISAGVGLVAGAGIVKAVAPAIATARQTEAIQEQTEVLKETARSKETGVSVTPLVPQQIAPTSPVTPQTQTLASTTPKKRKRRAKKAPRPSIKQSVNIAIQNNNTGIRATKKYLNREVLVL